MSGPARTRDARGWDGLGRSGRDLQDDLRRWADELERAEP